MQNLARRNPTPEQLQEINECVCLELRKAGIPAIPNDPKERGEVPAEFDGKYKGFHFKRVWYYWMVSGAVPLEVAKELFAHPYGAKDVRASGDCGCPPPEKWAVEIEIETDREVISDKEWENALRLLMSYPDTLARWKKECVREGETGKKRSFVLSYHIDTQEGLNFFMRIIRKHNLDGTTHN